VIRAGYQTVAVFDDANRRRTALIRERQPCYDNCRALMRAQIAATASSILESAVSITQ
jgi:hypothetical protein